MNSLIIFILEFKFEEQGIENYRNDSQQFKACVEYKHMLSANSSEAMQYSPFKGNDWQKLQFTDYLKEHDQISKYVRSLRCKKVQLLEDQKQKLNKASLALVDFLSKKTRVEDPLFLQALVSFDNALNLNGQILKEITFTKAFFTNINRYFLNICGNDENQSSDSEQDEVILTSFQKIIEKQNFKDKELQLSKQKEAKKSQKNFGLYCVFYLVVMIIYETSRREDHNLFMKHLLNSKFLCQFFSLQITKTNKMAKLIGIIITYLVKTINLTSEGKNLKRFVLNNLHLANSDDRIQFYFFYSIRAVKDHIMLAEVKKYHILDFLVKCLQKRRVTQQTYYIYDTFQFLLKKYSIIGYQLVNKNFFSLLQKDIVRHQNQVLRIFSMIAPCIPTRSRQQCLRMHINKISNAQQQNTVLSLKMVTILFNQSVDSGLFMQILRSKVIDQTIAILKDYPSPGEESSLLKFLNKFLSKAKQIDRQIFVFLFYKLIKEKRNMPESQRNKQFFTQLQSAHTVARQFERDDDKPIMCFSMI